MAWRTASESMHLRLLDLCPIAKVLATRARFLQLSGHCTFINFAFTFSHDKYFSLLPQLNGPVRTHKTSEQLSNHTLSESMLNVSAHYHDTINHNGYLSRFELLCTHLTSTHKQDVKQSQCLKRSLTGLKSEFSFF